MNDDAGTGSELEIDEASVLDGTLVLRQPRRGHRAGTDAILLAAAADPRPGDRFIDVGAGVGTVGLAMALRAPVATGVLLENEPNTARLARENIDRNGVGARIHVVEVDLLDPLTCQTVGLVASASLVVTNPPFFLSGAVRSPPNAGKAAAHVLQGTTPDEHAQWLIRCIGLLAPRGRVLMIHRPEVLPVLLHACRGRVGGLVLRAIHPNADAPARRILLGGIHGQRGPLTILPPLILHGPNGAFTTEAEAIHRGAPLPFWSQKSRP